MPLKILNACFWEEEREQSVSTFWFTCHNVHSNLRWASPSKNAGLILASHGYLIQYLSHHLLSPWVWANRELEKGVEPRLLLKHSIKEYWHSKSHLNQKPVSVMFIATDGYYCNVDS